MKIGIQADERTDRRAKYIYRRLNLFSLWINFTVLTWCSTSQLRGSIELDLQIFEDKKDFFSTKLAKLNNIEENLQLKSDEEERAGKDINKGLLDLEQGNIIITRLPTTLVWNFFIVFKVYNFDQPQTFPVLCELGSLLAFVSFVSIVLNNDIEIWTGDAPLR